MPEYTYVCAEPGCGDVFTDPEPSEAYGQYADHIVKQHSDGDLDDLDFDNYLPEVPD